MAARGALHLALDALAWPFTRARLAPGSLIDRARKRTGLRNFGPDGPFEDGLSVLCASLEEEAALSPLGRFLMGSMLGSALEVQLRLHDALVRDPSILDRPVCAPLIVIGMPRTGTTILHELLALDPANRCPLSWEVAHPFPVAPPVAGQPDARIAMTVRELQLSERLMPGLQAMHRVGAELPQECVGITAFAFGSMQYNTVLHIPRYARWLREEADHDRLYAFHRRFLQYLQASRPGLRWALKSPAHLWQLPAMLRAYPDARLVQTHRDPLSIISSLASMLPVLRGAYSAHVDRYAVAREWADESVSALDASMVARKAGSIPAAQVVDLQFRDFMRDPASAVSGIYEAFGYRFENDFAERIAAYIAANPAGGSKGHRHGFADTGLDGAAMRKRVSPYQTYFGVQNDPGNP